MIQTALNLRLQEKSIGCTQHAPAVQNMAQIMAYLTYRQMMGDGSVPTGDIVEYMGKCYLSVTTYLKRLKADGKVRTTTYSDDSRHNLWYIPLL